MKTFCTKCGTQTSAEKFCTSCGALVNESTMQAQSSSPFSEPVVNQTQTEVQTSEVSVTETKSKKPIIMAVVSLGLLVVVGVGSFLLGKSSVDLEGERQNSYKSGYDDGLSFGDTQGYARGLSAGDSRGYSRGFTAGCENVFDRADYASYLTEYNIYGYGFGKFPGSVYVSKSNC